MSGCTVTTHLIVLHSTGFKTPVHNWKSFRQILTGFNRIYTNFVRVSYHISLGATALGEPWPPQQSASITVYVASSPSNALSSSPSGLLPHRPSISKEVFLFFFLQSSFHHLSWHRSFFYSFYMSQPSCSLSFYKFHNILLLYGSIQLSVISNSPDILLFDWPTDLPL